MQLRYKDANGNETVMQLGAEPVIIGRASEADVVIEDEKASRRHCEIRLWDGDYVIKDLHSQNSTYVNDQHIDIAQLRPGDRIRVGAAIFFFEEKTPMGTSTAVHQVEDEMREGKGYGTILREIVGDIEKSPSKEKE